MRSLRTIALLLKPARPVAPVLLAASLLSLLSLTLSVRPAGALQPLGPDSRPLDMAGRSVDLFDELGEGSPTLLHFWTPAEGPQGSWRQLVELQERFPGVRVYSLANLAGAAEGAAERLSRPPAGITPLIDPMGMVWALAGDGSLPGVVLLDGSGRTYGFIDGALAEAGTHQLSGWLHGLARHGGVAPPEQTPAEARWAATRDRGGPRAAEPPRQPDRLEVGQVLAAFDDVLPQGALGSWIPVGGQLRPTPRLTLMHEERLEQVHLARSVPLGESPGAAELGPLLGVPELTATGNSWGMGPGRAWEFTLESGWGAGEATVLEQRCEGPERLVLWSHRTGEAVRGALLGLAARLRCPSETIVSDLR